MSDELAVLTTVWGLVMGLAPLLQVRVIVRRRDATGISLVWILVLFVGFVLWLAYGLSIGNTPIVVTNIVNVTVTAVLLAVVRVFRHPADPGLPQRDATP